MRKQNCWEFKKCGRQPQGAKVKELGVCPATLEARLDGVHDGVNSGRSCWIVAGTYCQGEIQGSFAQKYQNCSACDFYKAVKEEEQFDFKLSAVLINRLRNLNKAG